MLHKIQTDFSNFIYNGDEDILPNWINDSFIPIKERLRVYKDNIILNLIDTLKMKYPIIFLNILRVSI